MANPLFEAYQEIRTTQKKPFVIDHPQKTITLPIEKVFFSYLNDKLQTKTGHKVKYLYYQYAESADGNDSYGVHFEIDFVNTIVEVTETSVIVWEQSPFYHTDKNSVIKQNSIKFFNLSSYINSIKNPSLGSSLILVKDSGAAHTRAKGFDLNSGKYTVASLL